MTHYLDSVLYHHWQESQQVNGLGYPLLFLGCAVVGVILPRHNQPLSGGGRRREVPIILPHLGPPTFLDASVLVSKRQTVFPLVNPLYFEITYGVMTITTRVPRRLSSSEMSWLLTTPRFQRRDKDVCRKKHECACHESNPHFLLKLLQVCKMTVRAWELTQYLSILRFRGTHFQDLRIEDAESVGMSIEGAV